jgi:hypothetical protein
MIDHLQEGLRGRSKYSLITVIRVIDEDEGNADFYEENYSSLIQDIFGRRGRSYYGGYDAYDDYDDDDAAMESRFDDVEDEETFRYLIRHPHRILLEILLTT